MAILNDAVIAVAMIVILLAPPADVKVIDARKTCTVGMGVLCKRDCNDLCNQKHPGGTGYCDGIWPYEMCSCAYPCGPPDPPAPPERNCRGGGGACDHECGDSCCNQRCASQFRNGIGNCEYFASSSLCTCWYTC